MIVHNWHGPNWKRTKHSHRREVSLASVGRSWPSGDPENLNVGLTLHDDSTVNDEKGPERLSISMTKAEALDLYQRLGEMLK